jgi:hypothetical protein
MHDIRILTPEFGEYIASLVESISKNLPQK